MKGKERHLVGRIGVMPDHASTSNPPCSVPQRSSLFDGVKKMLQRSKPGDGEDASMSEGK